MTVFGWSSPWSGDEADPIPRRYWLWFQLYRLTRWAMHLVGRHDWRPRFGGERCDWCGGRRGLPTEPTR